MPTTTRVALALFATLTWTSSLAARTAEVAVEQPATTSAGDTSAAETAAAPQEPPPGARFEERVEVREVLLDVLVTDRQGQIVAGLDKDAFVVEEDGEERELTGARFYSTRYGELGTPGAEEVPASRYFIFVFHDQRLGVTFAGRMVRQQLDAARQSRAWLEDGMRPSDWVAVASYDVKLKVHQDFTQDREALARAMDDAARSVRPEPRRRRDREAIPVELPSLLRHLPDDFALRKRTPRMYEALQLLAEASGHIVGRKNLLLFSIGFGEIDRVSGTVLPDRRFYPPLERALNDNNVAVYPIDLTPTGIRHLQSDFLNKLAYDTGGVYHRSFVSFITPLREISDDTSGYYLLSYRTEHPADESGFQEVKVKVQQKGLRVRARRGYLYGPAPVRR